jgi:hypothetical protein
MHQAITTSPEDAWIKARILEAVVTDAHRETYRHALERMRQALQSPLNRLIQDVNTTEIQKRKGVKKLKSNGEQASSSTGGLQNRGRGIVPASEELSSPGQKDPRRKGLPNPDSPSIFSTEVPIGNMSTYGNSGSSERKVAQHFLFHFDTLMRMNSSPSPNPRHSVVASKTLALLPLDILSRSSWG